MTLPPVDRIINRSHQAMTAHLDDLAQQLISSKGPWICGTQFTLADVGMMVIFDRLREGDWLQLLVHNRPVLKPTGLLCSDDRVTSKVVWRSNILTCPPPRLNWSVLSKRSGGHQVFHTGALASIALMVLRRFGPRRASFLAAKRVPSLVRGEFNGAASGHCQQSIAQTRKVLRILCLYVL